jgi:DNA-binding LacI/PurR family transcriptional regulator
MITIKDVARVAGVSVGTVSKVFNGCLSVKPGTRERIFKAAAELDYAPNRSARQLANGLADTIGVVLCQFGQQNSRDEYLIGLLSGIYNEAEKSGLRVAMFTPVTVEKANQNYVQFCRSNRLIGLIAHGYDSTDVKLTHLADSSVPSVFIDMMTDEKGTMAVTVATDNIAAAAEVTDNLIRFGHRKIVFVSGREQAWVTQQRLKGYMQRMQSSYLTPVILQADFNTETSYERTVDFLARHADTEAFCCASDGIACGVLNACIKLGFKVPEDISVVGFDNLTLSGVTLPPLSTVAQDFFGMGCVSVQTLIKLSRSEPVQNPIWIHHRCVHRGSVIKRSERHDE